MPAANNAAGAGQSGCVSAAGDAEVNQIREVVLVEQDVGRFHVTVHQSDLVRGVQRLGYLLDDAHRPLRCQRPVGQHLLEIAALNQAHVHIQPPVDLPVVVDRNDVRVVQLCSRIGFPTKPRHECMVRGQLRRQHFDRHRAVVGRGVVGSPHLAHAALAEQLD